MSNLESTHSEHYVDVPIETVTVGHLTVTAYQVDHKFPPTELRVNRSGKDVLEEVDALIEQVDGVIVEYAPWESREVSDGLRVATGTQELFDENTHFFEPITTIAHRNDKSVLVMDPAYDQWFAWLSPNGQALMGLHGGLIGSGLSSIMMQRISKSESPPKSLTRRRLLTLAPLAVGGTILAWNSPSALRGNEEMKTQQPIHGYSEPELRRVIIAEGLKTLGSQPEFEGKHLLLIYPPVHWRGIRDLLADSQSSETFREYTRFIKGPLADKFLTIRQYSPSSNGWQAMPNIKIT